MKLGMYGEHLYSVGGGTVHALKFLEYLQDIYECDLFFPASVPIRNAQWYKDNSNVNVNKVNFLRYDPSLKDNYDVWISAWHSCCQPNDKAKQKFNIVWFPQVIQDTSGFINVANSIYTKTNIKEKWGVDAEVIYPPTSLFECGKEKEKIILHVSRFDIPNDASDKGQIHMINSFRELNNLGWKFVLAGTTDIGAVEERGKNYLSYLQKFAQDSNLNIEFVVNSSFKELKKLFQKSSIYWHCSGYNNTNPGAVEHFGLTILEGMSAGCVPISYSKGGPSETIKHDSSGYLYDDLKDLIKYTKKIIKDPKLLQTMSKEAVKRSEEFSEDNSKKNWVSLVTGSKDVTIIIGTHNNYKYIKNCLDSIKKHTPWGYKVIVVNNASTDGTKEYLDNLNWDNLTVINNKNNTSYAVFNNQALKKVDTKYVLFLNDDTIVKENWLPPLVNAIHKPNAGAVGSRLVYPNGTIQHDGVFFDKEGMPKHIGMGMLLDDDKDTIEVESITGACMLTHTKNAGFPEEYKKGYFEDTDYILSLREKGYRIYLAKESVVTHYEGTTMVKNKKETQKHLKENMELFKKKWYNKLDVLPMIETESKIIDAHNLTIEELRNKLVTRFNMAKRGDKFTVIVYDFKILNELYMQTLEQRFMKLIYDCKFGYTEQFTINFIKNIGYSVVRRDYNNIATINQHLMKLECVV
jgi:GT2 family glycosyltransferase/glycosyltransferase involved in cell wall biosynthesis